MLHEATCACSVQKRSVCLLRNTAFGIYRDRMLCMWTEYLLRLAVPCKKIPWDNNAQVLSQGGKGAKKQITVLLIPGRDYQNYTCAGPICSLLLYNPIYLWCFWCPPPDRQKTCLWKAAKHAKKRGSVRVQSTQVMGISPGLSAQPTPTRAVEGTDLIHGGY